MTITCRPIPGKNKYELLEEFSFHAFEKVWIIPAHFHWDGASIPRFFWRVVGTPFEPIHMRAALVHDWFCVYQPDGTNFEMAADLFCEMLLQDGKSRRMASIMRKAVVFGGPKWDKVVNEA